VTRLGEFSPIGRRFTLGSVFKIAGVLQIFGLRFSTVPDRYVLILTKKLVGLHLWRLFHMLIWSPRLSFIFLSRPSIWFKTWNTFQILHLPCPMLPMYVLPTYTVNGLRFDKIISPYYWEPKITTTKKCLVMIKI
jgi:hypothetical protein